jgi:hypothetical protein
LWSDPKQEGQSIPPAGSPAPGYPNPTSPYPAYADPANAGYQAGTYQPGGYQAGGHPSGGYQPGGYAAPPGYLQPYGYLAAPPERKNNGLAIAALVVSCVGVLGLCVYGLGGCIGAIGAILGHVARRQIRERGEGGDGMALAGVIVGWIATGLFVLAGISWGIFIWYFAGHPDKFESTSTTFIQLMVG